MNKKEIKADYTARKKDLKFHWHQGKTARKYAFRMRKTELKFELKTAEGPARKEAKKLLQAEKREYKKEAYLQKSIYLEKMAVLKKERDEALGSLVSKVKEHYAPESLAGGLTLSYTLIFLIFALVQGIFVITSSYYIINQRADETFNTVADGLLAGDLSAEMAEAVAESSELNIALYRPEGTQVYSFGMEELQAVLPYNQQWEESFSFRYQTESLRIYSRQVETEEGLFYLNMAKSVKREDALLSVIVNLLLVAVAVAGSVSYFVGYRTNKKMLRPIGVLGRAMEETNASNLSERLDTRNIRTELVEVVDAYNRMLDKIQAAYEQQKQFVSNASHELKTPLAVISGYSDILARWGTEDEAVTREAVEAILAQTNHMQALLERLLYLARSDNGRIQAELNPLPLEPLCSEILQDFRMMYPDRTFRLEGEITALCDQGMLRQILVILLDNAVKFTGEGGTVALKLYSRGGKACLDLRDDGVGMTPEVAEHAFDRFYKGDASRNEKGFGLGLSIAKLMTEAQKGTITLQSAPDEGTAFTLTLNI